MMRLVRIYVWLVTTVQLVAVIVLLWAMAAQGPALLRYVSDFVGE